MPDHIRQIPIHWNDCDPARIVFHAHYVRWMDEGFHEMAQARGVDLAAMQRAEPDFRASPLVDVSCAFRAPATHGDVLEHVIAPPEFGAGKSFRVRHAFRRGTVLVAEGMQVRIWGYAGADGTLRAVPVPPEIAARLRGEA